jgi:hypothetical protein
VQALAPATGFRDALAVPEQGIEIEPEPSRLEALRVSARGWHGVQLAVIGFIGLCGVLQGGRPDNPWWLQVFAGIMALVALALALVATFLVALVAWPLYGPRRQAVSDETAELERGGRRIKLGLVLTFAALASLALGTASGWWPQDESGGGGGELVAVQEANGDRWCGALGEASPGAISVSVDGEPVVVALRDVVAVGPVDGC